MSSHFCFSAVEGADCMGFGSVITQTGGNMVWRWPWESKWCKFNIHTRISRCVCVWISIRSHYMFKKKTKKDCLGVGNFLAKKSDSVSIKGSRLYYMNSCIQFMHLDLFLFLYPTLYTYLLLVWLLSGLF